MAPGPTAGRGSRSAVVTPQTRDQLEVGIPGQRSPSRPGFFAGAKDIDVRHGTFTDVAGGVRTDIAGDVKIDIAGDVNITLENKVRWEVFE
jgi:hypothetical protein